MLPPEGSQLTINAGWPQDTDVVSAGSFRVDEKLVQPPQMTDTSSWCIPQMLHAPCHWGAEELSPPSPSLLASRTKMRSSQCIPYTVPLQGRARP